MKRRAFLRYVMASGSSLLCLKNGFSDRARDLNGQKVKEELVKLCKDLGAYEVKIADPSIGFEHCEKGARPLEQWPQCKSVVVLAVPNIPFDGGFPKDQLDDYLLYSKNSDGEYINVRLKDPNDSGGFLATIHPLSEKVTIRILPKLMGLLSSKGIQVKQNNMIERASGTKINFKMCAYASGIGLYGRSGFILHPEMGNRVSLHALYTDAELPPDKIIEDDFRFCDRCGVCVNSCPVNAYDVDGTYPKSYDFDQCGLGRNRSLVEKRTICNICYRSCVFCKTTDDEIKGWLERPA